MYFPIRMKPAPLTSPTGIPGLDEIMKGGLPSNRLYLVRGEPGAGKTTLSMQFLLEGERRGEKRPVRHLVRDQG